LYENTVRLICKGKLQRCDTYKAMTNVDMSSQAYNEQLDPPEGYGHSDEVMVTTILFIAGLATATDPAADGILGTGRTLGSVCGGKGFEWDKGSSALSWIESLEQVTLGYRTFDAMDGTIKRQQISTVPSATADWTFTEGVDIFRASESETILDTRNEVVVSGWNGDKTERTYTARGTNPWLVGTEAGGTATQWYLSQRIDSPMIEQSDTIGGTAGISAREVASWQLAELNRRVERVTLTTPRDDLVQPGQTVAIAAPIRLGIDDVNYWVQNVDVSADRRGSFSQVLTCLTALNGESFAELGDFWLLLEGGSSLLLETSTGDRVLKE
jgi:hypothetical protein